MRHFCALTADVTTQHYSTFVDTCFVGHGEGHVCQPARVGECVRARGFCSFVAVWCLIMTTPAVHLLRWWDHDNTRLKSSFLLGPLSLSQAPTGIWVGVSALSEDRTRHCALSVGMGIWYVCVFQGLEAERDAGETARRPEANKGLKKRACLCERQKMRRSERGWGDLMTRWEVRPQV